jgi:hypothetical protein
VKTDLDTPRSDSGGRVQRDSLRRRAYAKPRILSREPLEAAASVCVGNNAKATTPPCIGPISS